MSDGEFGREVLSLWWLGGFKKSKNKRKRDKRKPLVQQNYGIHWNFQNDANAKSE